MPASARSTPKRASSARTTRNRADGAKRTGSGRPVTLGGVAPRDGLDEAEGGGADRLAGDQQVDPLGRAGAGDEGVEGDRLLQDRGRSDVGPDLLQQEGELDHTQPEPTPVLGHGDGRPALVDHGRPEVGVEPAAGVDDRAHPARRRLAVEQRAGGVPQRLLVVRELEIHVRTIAPQWT